MGILPFWFLPVARRERPKDQKGSIPIWFFLEVISAVGGCGC